MKLDINKLDFIKNSDNIYQMFHDGKPLKFWTPVIEAPFGVDHEYNKYLIKLEINQNESNKYFSEHAYFKKILLHVEKLVKQKMDIDDIEFKSILKTRPNKGELVECRIKTLKKNIMTEIEYTDKEANYLKTIFDMPKNSWVTAQIELYGVWDYRVKDVKEKNKVGLILYINKIKL
jgi:hypothetical protein